jgi:hypothetical protein
MGPGSIAVPPVRGNVRVRRMPSTAVLHPPSVETAADAREATVRRTNLDA